jgi:GNAT superfamily N-acetyltransferase
MRVVTLKTEPLTRHRELIPVVAHWFTCEWPTWYGPDGPGNATEDLEAFAASEEDLPVGYLVFEAGIPVGIGALKSTSITSHLHLSPWAAAGFVLPSRRGKGVGLFLLRELVVKARQLGYAHVYCGTSTAQSLLIRAGWAAIEAHAPQQAHAPQHLVCCAPASCMWHCESTSRRRTSRSCCAKAG